MNDFYTPVVDVTDVQTVWMRVAFALLHSMWIGAAIGVLALFAFLLLRRTKRHGARYAVLVSSLFATAASPVFIFVALAPPTATKTFDPLYRRPPVEVPGRWVMAKPLKDPARQLSPEAPQSSQPIRVVDEADNVYVLPEQVTGAYAEGGFVPVVREGSKTMRDFVPSPKAIVLAYLAIAAALLARLAIGIAGGSRLRRKSELVTDGALLSALARRARSLSMRIAPPLPTVNAWRYRRWLALCGR